MRAAIRKGRRSNIQRTGEVLCKYAKPVNEKDTVGANSIEL